MTDNSPQNVSVQVEADATQAVNSINAVVKELGGIIGKVGQLEASLKRMLGDQLPANLEKTGAKLKYLQEVAKTASLIAKGAPDTQLKSAAFAAERNKIQADGVLQKIKLEKELNKVIEARGEIYKRSQAQLPTNVSERSGVKAYRDNLSTIVPPPKGKAELKAWRDETLNQYRYFNQKQIAEEAAAAAKLEAHRQKLADAKAKRDKERQDRDAANAQANQEKLNLQARTQLFADEENDKKAAKSKAERDAKRAATAAKVAADKDKADQEAIEQRNIKARVALAVDEKNDKKAADSKAERDAKAAATAAKVAADKELAAAKAQERWMSKSYGKLFKMDPAQRETEVQAALDKLEAHAARRGITGFDRQRAYSNYQDEMAARSLVPAPPPKTHADKVAQGYQNTHDRFNYRGGAGMFEIQGDILRNYATMGAVLSSVGFAARSTIEFEAAMKDVQAVSASTDLELKGLTKTVFEVANTTKFSAKEMAEGAKTLAQAGYSVQQISQMLKPIGDLATGSGSSLADAAATTTSVLSVFDLSVGRTAEVTNTLTAGLNQSKLSMEQMSLGIQYAGNIAADGGVQFEELVGALGAMSNAGIKSGSTLGTGLRALIQDLENPSQKFVERLTAMGLTAEDVNIKTHGLAEVMQTLKTAGFDSAAAMGSFEVRAAAAYSALSNNLNVYNELEQNIIGTSAATAAAATQMDSFSAQWQRLTTAVTQFTYTAGAPLLGTFQALAGMTANLFNGLSQNSVAAQALGTVLGSLATAAAGKWALGLIAGLLGMEKAFAGVTLATIRNAVATATLTGSWRALAASVIATSKALLASPMFWATAALTALSVAVSLLSGRHDELNAKIDKFSTAANEASAKSEDYSTRVRELDNYVEKLSARSLALSSNTNALSQEAETATGKFGSWGLQLGENIKTVDQLIQKTIELRGEMARIASGQSAVQAAALRQQADTQVLALNSEWATTKRDLRDVRLSDPAANAVVQQIKSSRYAPDAATAAQWAETLAKARNAPGLTNAQKSTLDRTLRIFQPVATRTGQLVTTRSQIRQADTQAVLTGIQGATSNYTNSMNAPVRNYNAMLAEAYKIKDPTLKLKEIDRVKELIRAEFPSIRDRKGTEASNLAQDPRFSQYFTDEGAKQGMSGRAYADQFLSQNSDYGRIAMLAGDTNYTPTKGDLEARRSAAKIELRAAKGRDPVRAKRLQEEINTIGENLFSIEAAANPNMSPEEQYNRWDSLARGNEAGLDLAGRMPGGGTRGQSKAANNKVKALERLIEQTAAGAGPDAKGIAAAAPKLKALLGEWKVAKRAADPSTSLEDFNTLAQEYTDKILQGNIQAAKETLAEEAKRAADLTSARNASAIGVGTKDVTASIEEVTSAYNDAATKAMDASDESFKTQFGAELNTQQAHDAFVKRRDIMEAMVTASLDAVNAQLQALADRQDREIAAAQFNIDERRANISMLSNSWGSRNISDVQRYLGGLAGEKLDIETQQLDVRDKRNKAGNAQIAFDAANNTAAWQPGNAKFQEQLRIAREEVEKTQLALKQSELNLSAMTGEATPFATLSEAIRGSWEAYADQAKLAQPVLTQIADGLSGVFENARGSFKTLITDVVTGSKTMGDAMKDFTLSVLQSFLDLAAQMLANAALKWVMQTILSAFGKSPGAPTPDGSSFAAPWANSMPQIQGGEVLRRAQGGPSPFRDSVHTLLQPGEIVMRRSAVDFIGKENLLDMNNMGNRRVSQMPTVASSRREPDNVNVWVVAPETKPQMGKSDILATISQDIMTGGRTKQLIKAVQMGAA